VTKKGPSLNLEDILQLESKSQNLQVKTQYLEKAVSLINDRAVKFEQKNRNYFAKRKNTTAYLQRVLD
jgi:hypothetical protein